MYEAKKFNIPELGGISKKTIEEHLKLYEGYVKHFNLIHEIAENQNIPEYAKRETYRRQSFEFDGIRNHEYYFYLLEGAPQILPGNSPLYKKITEAVGSFEDFLKAFKGLATTRGVGWAMLGYDLETDRLLQYWVDEQHLGHLTGVVPIVTLDMWEHSYCMDYAPSEKMKYVDAFFQNLNWETAAQFYDKAAR